MPLYTYKCNNCEQLFEKRQKMSDDPLSDCIYCEGSVRRVINSVGIVFKGKGFYVTDNRGKKNGASSSSTTKTDSTEKGSDTKTTESSDTKSKDSSDSSSTTKKAEKTAD